MAVYRAAVYVGQCNPVRVRLDAARGFDWGAVTGMAARVGDVVVDSATSPTLISWAPHEDGGLAVEVRLGSVLEPGVNTNMELLVRYTGCPDGHVWVPAEGGRDQIRVRSYA